MPGRVLVVCNSRLPARSLVDELVAWAEYRIGADSGADRLLAAGHVVDEIVGDMDSASEEVQSRVGRQNVRRIDDPNTTDLDKCLARARQLGAEEVRVIGATAGRLDHILGATASLAAAAARPRVVLVDDDFDTWRVDGRTQFSAPLGTVVSLMAPQGADGVTTSGLRWPLRSAHLPFSTLGVHNNVVGDPVVIEVRSGILFVLRGRFVEPHR